jgi:hypothetical protein
MCLYADLGIEELHVMPSSGNPAAFIDGLAQNVAPISPTCDDPSYPGDPGGPGPPGRGFGAADGIQLSITKRQVQEVTPVTNSRNSTVRVWA